MSDEMKYIPDETVFDILDAWHRSTENSAAISAVEAEEAAIRALRERLRVLQEQNDE